MKFYSIILVALCLMSCSKKEAPLKSSNAIDTTANTISYVASTADIVNPERGFYQAADIYASNYVPLSESVLAGYRTVQSIPGATYSVATSLVFVEYVLDSFTNSPISSSFLNNFDADCATARMAGVKLIPRFIYTNTTHSGSCPGQSICAPYGDAPKAIVLSHISQLQPFLQKNADVIACMQLGFIGIWGEGYYSDYFGDASTQGKLLDANWQDRIDVVKALLAAVPVSRMVQVRIPQLQERYAYGIQANVISPALTIAQAFTGTDQARLGFHNDCFLSGTDDQGTYTDYGNTATPSQDATTALSNFEKANSQFTVVGGETCSDAYVPQNNCSPTGIAQQTFASFHYSFLNAQYNVSVNDNWVTGGCMDEIKQKLGYRLVLHTASIPGAASVNGKITVALNIENVGYASPYNARPLQLILRNKATNIVTAVNFSADVRTWYTGIYNVQESLSLPAGMAAGTYDVLLNLPDNYASISTRPEYSIQLANNNTWESATGYNSLNATIQLK